LAGLYHCPRQDDVASEDGELRATLILDEISEYYEKDKDAPGGGQKYYKIMVHLYNSGHEPICGAMLSLSETAEVEQAWTVEQVGYMVDWLVG
jgi:hypothetical protein